MSKSEGKKTKALFIDFDGTLTAEHTGGAVFIDLNDGDRCWRPGLGEGALSSNVASGEAGWTFRLLYDLVMTQKVCVAILVFKNLKLYFLKNLIYYIYKLLSVNNFSSLNCLF